MPTTVSVGQFATMTHLSIKTLRHYHQVGLLEPDRVDALTGYRYYALDQLPSAQLIRRLRDLRMPIPDIRSVLVAGAPEQQNALISAHLNRLEAELVETRTAVDSLRTLLDTARRRAPVTRRSVPAQHAIAVTDAVGPGQVMSWWEDALSLLHAYVLDAGLKRTGPPGGLFDETLYQQGSGRAWVYIPVAEDSAADTHGRIELLEVPAAELVLTVHHGAAADLDLAHADLGSYLAEQDLRVGSLIREHYLRDRFDTPDAASWQTEIAWPIEPG